LKGYIDTVKSVNGCDRYIIAPQLIHKSRFAHPPGFSSMSSAPAIFIETRSLPTLTHCFPRSFTSYVAHLIHSIVEDLYAALAQFDEIANDLKR
jgi:hypothetical protein